MYQRRLLPWTLAISFLLHGVAYASLDAAPPALKPTPRQTQLRFEVVEKVKPPPPPPQAEPAPARSKPQRGPSEKPKVAPPATDVPAPPPVESSNGVTLAGDGSGPGFAMPLGTGGALEPSPAPVPAPVNVPAPATPVPARADRELVPVGDLSERPAPPALGPALERNYPPDARRRGLSGTAKVRARIDADGVVRRVSLLEESAAGFGAACSRTLNGSRWAAPKDKAGRAVATEIRYTCRFVVE
jgi:periplasmic protein TonB